MLGNIDAYLKASIEESAFSDLFFQNCFHKLNSPCRMINFKLEILNHIFNEMKNSNLQIGADRDCALLPVWLLRGLISL
ncbi:hypothetical protein QTP88_005692 [Uroleucon formosanum]